MRTLLDVHKAAARMGWQVVAVGGAVIRKDFRRMFGAELLRLLQIAYKVKNFFFEHARNRHKMLVTDTFPR